MSKENSNGKFWKSQILTTNSSNSTQDLNKGQQLHPPPSISVTCTSRPSKSTWSTYNINVNQHQRELRQRELVDQHVQSLVQQQILFSQQPKSSRSIAHLPSTTSYNSNNSYMNANESTSNLNSSTSHYHLGNTKSLFEDFKSSRPNLSMQGSRSNVSAYNSYENYVNERCRSKSPDYTITNSDLEKFNRIRGEDLNIENSKWLEEKPISVLQLDQPDRAVLKIADQRDKIQKKTFTKWINKYLNKQTVKVNDLFEDLRDGVCLIALLQILSRQEMVITELI